MRWPLLVTALALEVAVAFGLAWWQGHDLADDYVSTLGATDAATPLAFALLAGAAALLHGGFAAVLWRATTRPPQRAALGLFSLFFLLLLASLAFPCDPGCGLTTQQARIHHTLGFAAFTALGLAALTAMAAWWRTWPIVATGACVALADVALLVADATQWHRGGVERIAIVAMMAWSVALAVSVPGGPTTLATPRP